MKMLHPLERKIVALRRRVRQAAAIHGLSVVTAAGLGAIVAIGSIDYLLQLQDRGLRIIASLSALGVLGWTSYRFIGATVFARLRDVDLALRVERAFPNLEGRLASAVEFLHQPEDDPTAGSAALRRAMIAQTTTETQRIEFSRVLDPRRMAQAAALLATACFLAGALVALAPTTARIAVARLMNPFGDTAWPQKSMPRSNVAETIEPPTVESLSIRLVPPAYTGWPTVQSERHIRALAGTEARIAGKAAKPLASVDLCLEGGKRVPARVGDDGRTFSIGYGSTPLVIEKSGTYWFELTNRRGTRGGDDDRWEVRAAADSPPVVRIERPAADLFVTPRAVAPIRVLAKDDLAVQDVALAFRRDGSAAESSLPLFSGPKPPPRRPAWDPAGDSRMVDYRWDLGPLNLQPGTQLVFYATANDYLPQVGRSDLRRLIVVAPDELQNRIANREKLIMAELERALKMQRTGREQVESLRGRFQDRSAGILPAQSGRDGRAAVDQLQAAEHGQRDVNQLLTSRGEGVPMHVLTLLADLENNRIDNADIRQRMASLLELLDRLDREHLPTISRELTAAVKTARIELEGQGGAAGADGGVAERLAAAGKHQDAVIAAIEQWLGQLAKEDSYRRFHRRLGQLLRDEEDVRRRTLEVGRRTLAQELLDLSPGEAADLRTAAGRQFEIARSLDRLLQEMDQAGGELRQNDPSAAKNVAPWQNDPSATKGIADALAKTRRLGVGGRMLAVGGQIERNRIGQATAGQKRIVKDLQEVLDVLARGRRQDGEPEETERSHQKDSSQDGPVRSGDKPAAGQLQPSGEGTVRRPDAAESRAMMRRLWGQLPQHARQQMLQAPVEEFSPKYELLIEEYFRRLSEGKGER